jgi:hypothetical protein
MTTTSVAMPAAWARQFDGTTLATKLHVAAVLGTVDDAGWAHLAYLSVGEVLAHGTQTFSLTLWPSSRSTANLRCSGRGVLHAVADGSIWEARFVAKQRVGTDEQTIVFDADVVEVRQHSAPYAEVTGLVGFQLKDPLSTVNRWQRQIDRMRDSTG